MSARHVRVGDRVTLRNSRHYHGVYPVVGVVHGRDGHVVAVQVDVGRADGHLCADVWGVEIVGPPPRDARASSGGAR